MTACTNSTCTNSTTAPAYRAGLSINPYEALSSTEIVELEMWLAGVDLPQPDPAQISLPGFGNIPESDSDIQ